MSTKRELDLDPSGGHGEASDWPSGNLETLQRVLADRAINHGFTEPEEIQAFLDAWRDEGQKGIDSLLEEHGKGNKGNS